MQMMKKQTSGIQREPVHCQSQVSRQLSLRI